jgi:hypothetical protein
METHREAEWKRLCSRVKEIHEDHQRMTNASKSLIAYLRPVLDQTQHKFDLQKAEIQQLSSAFAQLPGFKLDDHTQTQSESEQGPYCVRCDFIPSTRVSNQLLCIMLQRK